MEYVKKRIPITTDSWTPISTPIAMPVMLRGMSIKNASQYTVDIRTDPDDPETEDYLDPGVQEIIPQAFWVAPNTAILWAKARSGTGPLIVTTLV